MKKRGLALFGASILGGALLAACSDRNVPVGAPHGLGKSWVGADPGQIAAHGGDYRSATLDCSECHDLGSYCASRCHFDPNQSDVRVPPGSGWIHRAPPPSHGFLADDEDVCTTCHRILRGYNEGPGPCHDCHGYPSAPHPLGQPWLDSESSSFHGTAATADAAYCASCHEESVFCYQCHFGGSGSRVPEGVSWEHGTTPHSDLSAYDTVCEACHDLTRSFRSQPATCHGCHAAHPVGQPWLDKKVSTFHGAAAKQDLPSCSPCHGSDYQGGTANVGCYTCHFGPEGNQSPTGAQHVGKSESTHRRYTAYRAVCNACHRTNRLYGNAPRQCHDCHDD